MRFGRTGDYAPCGCAEGGIWAGRAERLWVVFAAEFVASAGGDAAFLDEVEAFAVGIVGCVEHRRRRMIGIEFDG